MLHKSLQGDSWVEWSKQNHCPDLNPVSGPRYDLYSMIIEAACAGLGVGLVPRLYIAAELTQERLVLPFDAPLRDGKHFCVVYPEDHRSRRPLQVFLDWIKAEAEWFEDAAGRRGESRQSVPKT